ncbi:hypothetical protein LOC70_07115 [Rhodopirellula sp. JC737]|nr:hypothetical protein [Rhodopirellula sp. JC737]
MKLNVFGESAMPRRASLVMTSWLAADSDRLVGGLVVRGSDSPERSSIGTKQVGTS